MDVKSELFPTEKIGNVSEISHQKWLIENIWLESACGIIGGQPKCCKSWLGLDMAISVATGTPCLGIYHVNEPGATLVFMAEDRVEEVKKRVEGIALQRGISLKDINLHLITAASVRLDSELDQNRLDATIAAIRPRLVLLDPLVRLHRLDENSAREISGLLGFLRELERRHKIALVLAHHASKKGGSRPGQGLRGSSDLHAFGDSNIYLSRKGNDIEMTVEHRSAGSIDPIQLQLATEPSVHLALKNAHTQVKTSEDLDSRILKVLKLAEQPLSRQQLRESLKINNQRLGIALNKLASNATILTKSDGISLAH